MGTSHPAKLPRRTAQWVVVLALVIISVFAVQRTILLGQQLADEEAERAEQTLRVMLRYWEDAVFEDAAQWIAEISQSDDLWETEVNLQRRTRWIDAIYVWTPDPDGPKLHHPVKSPAEQPEDLLSHPCIFHANQIAALAPAYESSIAFRECRNNNAIYHIYSSSIAAAMLLSENHDSAAWTALNEVKTPLLIPIRQAIDSGLSPTRLVVRRIQGAQALARSGQGPKSHAILLSTIREIASMPGPQIAELAPFTEFTIPYELTQTGVDLDRRAIGHATTLSNAKRSAYEDISQRLIYRPIPEETNLMVAVDPYGQSPYLLIYGVLNNGRTMAAIQLNTTSLLESLPITDHLPTRVIFNAEGDTVYPQIPQATEDLWVTVPFGRLLPHLRAGLLTDPTIGRHTDMVWLASQLLPILLAFLLGGVAIVTQFRLDRQQRRLFQRQRDFITRVTHELKTPIAGIRLMAENLEISSQRQGQSNTFAQRILDESDRLSARIDEVLKAAKTPTIRHRVVTDLATLCTSIAQDWDDRFIGVGGKLVLNLNPVQIAVDKLLVEDAVNNLIGNALKYRKSNQALICTIATHGNNKKAIITVSDNGMGIPSDLRSTIFERFTRVEDDERGAMGGHGLGLWFVKKTAKAHRGSVEYKQTTSGGSQFIVTLKGVR